MSGSSNSSPNFYITHYLTYHDITDQLSYNRYFVYYYISSLSFSHSTASIFGMRANILTLRSPFSSSSSYR